MRQKMCPAILRGAHWWKQAWVLAIFISLATASSQTPIGHWSFDDTGTWAESGGTTPQTVEHVSGVGGLVGQAVQLPANTLSPPRLVYPRTDSGSQELISGVVGSIRLWFRPDWSSAVSGSGGPGDYVRLIEQGTSSQGSTHGSWTLYIDPDGTNLCFGAELGGTWSQLVNAGVQFTSNTWYQIVLTYDANATKLYRNGQLLATGSGISGSVNLQDLSVGSAGTQGSLVPAYWVDDPNGLNPNSGYEYMPDTGDYLFGYWIGTWVEDSGYTNPDTYFREIYDGDGYLLFSEDGYWDPGLDGKNQSVDGVIDELETFDTVLTATKISQDYAPFGSALDSDGDGLADSAEATHGTSDTDPDTDDDGVSDGQEVADGTDPLSAASFLVKRLAHWTLDDAGLWVGDGGQTPTTKQNLETATGLTNGAVLISSSSGAADQLVYSRVHTNGNANAMLRSGTIRFQLQPQWSSSPDGDPANGGPGSIARLIELGTVSQGTNHGSWSFYVNAAGTTLDFGVRSNGVWLPLSQAVINWTSGTWYDVAVAYSPSNSGIVIGGTVAAPGYGVPAGVVSGSLSVGAEAWDGPIQSPQWIDDPNGDNPNSLYEWSDTAQDYVLGYWIGTWVTDWEYLNNDTYDREAYVDQDAIDNSDPIIYEPGYWVDAASGANSSAKAIFDEIETFNYPVYQLGDPPTPPSIVTQPQGDSVIAGSSVTFTVTADGTAPLNYQWRKDGTSIAGANAASYAIAAAQSADAADYSVEISNAHGSVTSSAATLTVNDPPSISTQPQSLDLATGSDASFSVVANGTAPLSYQWRKDGTDLPGETAATLNLTAIESSDAGAYTVAVSSPYGSATSDAADLTVGLPPTVSTQPAAVSLVEGQNATFTVVATGTAVLLYQWRKDGGAIANATNNSLTITSTTPSDAGAYSVAITNDYGGLVSDDAQLTVNSPPSITGQPVSQDVALGSQVSFSVQAAGTAPLSYQWTFNQNAISDATNSTFTIAAVQAGDIGDYAVVVDNDYGSAASDTATLAVGTPPTINTHPADQDVLIGAGALFTVGAAGSSPLSYYWRKDGAVIPGAIAASLNISPVVATDAAAYSVMVSNAYGTVTSSSGDLIVHFPPAINSQPQSLTVAGGADATFVVVAGGEGPFSYQWRKDGVDIADATNSTFTVTSATSLDGGDYTVAVANPYAAVVSEVAVLTVEAPPAITQQPAGQSVAPAAPATFSVSAVGVGPITYQWCLDFQHIPGATSSTYSVGSAGPADAGIYVVLVSNGHGTVMSDQAVLTVETSPAFTSHPQAATVAENASVTFSAVAIGSGPITYQWRRDGVDIADATNSSLTISSAQTADEGSYDLVASNPFGATASVAAVLTVSNLPTITQDPQATVVTVGDVAEFAVIAGGAAPLSYQWRRNGVDIAGADSATYQIQNVQIGHEGDYSVEVANSYGTIASAAASLTVHPVDLLFNGGFELPGDAGTLDEYAMFPGGSVAVPGWIVTGAGVEYFDPNKSAWGTASRYFGHAQEGRYLIDLAADQQAAGGVLQTFPTVPGQAYRVTFYVGTLQSLGRDGTCEIVASAGGLTHIFNLTNLTAEIVWFPLSLDFVAQDAISTLSFSNDQLAHRHYAFLDNVSVSLRDLSGLAPALLSHPESVTANEGSLIEFSTVALGEPPLTYQWRRNGANLSGANSATYSLAAAAAVDAGDYAVVVANAIGAVTSSVAQLTLMPAGVAPTISEQPVSQNVVPGGTVELAVAASGTLPLSYQWSRDGDPIPGATAAAYAVSGAVTDDAGTYSVQVSNSFGSVNSSDAVLTVTRPPVITAQPLGKSVVEGTAVTFSVIADGDAPLTYQWCLDFQPIPDATNTTYTIASAQTNHAGIYLVEVFNPHGQVMSHWATLTVTEQPQAPVVLLYPGSQVVTEGEPVNVGVLATGTTPLSYQWYLDGNQIQGATNAVHSLSTVSTNDAGEYSVIITNIAGAASANHGFLTVIPAPLAPSILLQPKSQTNLVGDPLSLVVSAVGSVPMTFEWRKDGAPIPGATNAVYHVASANLTDSGNYFVRISNQHGTVDSWTAVVKIETFLNLEVDGGDNEVVAGWKEHDEIDVYSLYRKGPADSGFVHLLDLSDGYYQDRTVTNGSWYEYFVGAMVDGTYVISEIRGATPFAGPPYAPKHVKHVRTHESISLSWRPAAGADRYRIEYAYVDAPDVYYPIVVTTNLTHEFEHLNRQKGHLFRIIALNEYGESEPSPPLETRPLLALIVRQNMPLDVMVQFIMGENLPVFDVGFLGDTNSYGLYDNGVEAGLGMQGGLLMTSGHAQGAIGPNRHTYSNYVNNGISLPHTNVNPHYLDGRYTYRDGSHLTFGFVTPAYVSTNAFAFDGMERGTYEWNSTNGTFAATPAVDTNGELGLNAPVTSVTVVGDALTFHEVWRTRMFGRVTDPANPIVGSWQYGDGAADGSGIVVFLANGVYFHAADTNGVALDGMERGTYVWDATAGTIVGAPAVDTNGELGLNEPWTSVSLVGDTLTFIDAQGARALSRVTDPANSLVGGWQFGDGAADDSGVVVFLANGVYFNAEDMDAEAVGYDGMEGGAYAWNAADGAFTSTPAVDTNGELGPEDAYTEVTVAENTLTFNEEWGSRVFGRVTHASNSIVGGWQLGDGAGDDSEFLVFLANGVYFHAVDVIPSAAGFDGMERGTYAWNATNENFIATPDIDTNGELGMDAQLNSVTVAGDNLTLHDGQGSREFSRVINSTNSIVGSWQFGDGAADNSGVLLFLTNGVYFHAEDVSDPPPFTNVTFRVVYASDDYPSSPWSCPNAFNIRVNGDYAKATNVTEVFMASSMVNHALKPEYYRDNDDAQEAPGIEYDGLTRILEFVATVEPGAANTASITLGEQSQADFGVFFEGHGTADGRSVVPAIKRHPESLIVNYGETAAFDVKVSGVEPLHFQWRRDGVAIPGATNTNYVVVSATLADIGAITLMVTNEFGRAYTIPANLDVLTALALTANTATQAVELTWQSITNADGYQLFRQLSPDDPFDLIWETNGLAFTNVLDTNSISLPNPHIRYQLHATNSSGLVQQSRIVPGVPYLPVPGVPSGVKVSLFNGMAVVKWDPVPGAAGYVVHYINGYDEPWRVAGHTDATLFMMKLDPGKEYIFQVTAANGFGPGGASQSIVAAADSRKLQVAPGVSALQLIEQLKGQNVEIYNAKFTGDMRAQGLFYNGRRAGLGIESGILLSSGSARHAVGPNYTKAMTGTFNTPGDADIQRIFGGDSTHDAAVLEFDFVPQNETITIQYVFASEEYKEFVGRKSVITQLGQLETVWTEWEFEYVVGDVDPESDFASLYAPIFAPHNDHGNALCYTEDIINYNDKFAFLINGTNTSLIEGTVSAVAIESINHQINARLFRDNDIQIQNANQLVTRRPAAPGLEYDGLTKVLEATALVNAGETNRAKLVIADVADPWYDSTVFIAVNSFSSGAPSIPANFAVETNNSLVVLSWDQVPGATSYNIYRRSAGEGNFSLIEEKWQTTLYVDRFAAPGIGHEYYVRAVNIFGEGGSTSTGQVDGPSDPQITGDPLRHAVLTVQTNVPLSQIDAALVGAGVQISGLQITGSPEAYGLFGNGSAAGVGLAEGIILSTGRIIDAPGPNSSDSRSTDFGLLGDGQLDNTFSAQSQPSHDAVSMSFDVVPSSSALTLRFVFASEEYRESVNSGFNDRFAIYVDGLNVTEFWDRVNAMSVNTVNLESNPEKFRDNHRSLPKQAAPGIEFDGLTRVMDASVPVNAGVANHIRLVLADGGDAGGDTAVFISQHSLVDGAPAAPAGFTAVDTNCVALLSWLSSPGATEYHLYRQGPDDPSFRLHRTNLYSTHFRDIFVVPEQTYQYYALAVNRLGQSAPSVTNTVTINCPLPGPTTPYNPPPKTFAQNTNSPLDPGLLPGLLDPAELYSITNLSSTNVTTGWTVAGAAPNEDVVRHYDPDTNVYTLPDLEPPLVSIIQHPASTHAFLGTTTTLQVIAQTTGAGPLSYQWYHDGALIDGGTSSNLTLTNITSYSDGFYHAMVSVPGASVASRRAHLRILKPGPYFVDPPQNQRADIGDPVTFTVSAVGQYAPVFQWYFNGLELVDETNATLTIPSMQASDVGVYTVIATDVSDDPANAPFNTAVAAAHAGLKGLEFVYTWNEVVGSLSLHRLLALTNNYGGSELMDQPLGMSNHSVNVIPLDYYQPAADIGTINPALFNHGLLGISGYEMARIPRPDATVTDTWFNGLHVSLTDSNADVHISPAMVAETGADVVSLSSCRDSVRVHYDDGSFGRLLLTASPRLTKPERRGSRIWSMTGVGDGYLLLRSDRQVTFMDEPFLRSYLEEGVATRAQDRSWYPNSLQRSDQKYGQVSLRVGNVIGLVETLPQPTLYPPDTHPGSVEEWAGGPSAWQPLAATNNTSPWNFLVGAGAGGLPGLNRFLHYDLPATNQYDSSLLNSVFPAPHTPQSYAVVGISNSVQIVRHPLNFNVAPGSTVTFDVEAIGLGPLSYQWRHDGRPIALANSANLALTNVSPADSGHYSVLVVDAHGAITRTAGSLIVAERYRPYEESVATNWNVVDPKLMAVGGFHNGYRWSLLDDGQLMLEPGNAPWMQEEIDKTTNAVMQFTNAVAVAAALGDNALVLTAEGSVLRVMGSGSYHGELPGYVIESEGVRLESVSTNAYVEYAYTGVTNGEPFDLNDYITNRVYQWWQTNNLSCCGDPAPDFACCYEEAFKAVALEAFDMWTANSYQGDPNVFLSWSNRAHFSWMAVLDVMDTNGLTIQAALPDIHQGSVDMFAGHFVTNHIYTSIEPGIYQSVVNCTAYNPFAAPLPDFLAAEFFDWTTNWVNQWWNTNELDCCGAQFDFLLCSTNASHAWAEASFEFWRGVAFPTNAPAAELLGWSNAVWMVWTNTWNPSESTNYTLADGLSDLHRQLPAYFPIDFEIRTWLRPVAERVILPERTPWSDYPYDSPAVTHVDPGEGFVMVGGHNDFYTLLRRDGALRVGSYVDGQPEADPGLEINYLHQVRFVDPMVTDIVKIWRRGGHHGSAEQLHVLTAEGDHFRMDFGQLRVAEERGAPAAPRQVSHFTPQVDDTTDIDGDGTIDVQVYFTEEFIDYPHYDLQVEQIQSDTRLVYHPMLAATNVNTEIRMGDMTLTRDGDRYGVKDLAPSGVRSNRLVITQQPVGGVMPIQLSVGHVGGVGQVHTRWYRDGKYLDGALAVVAVGTQAWPDPGEYHAVIYDDVMTNVSDAVLVTRSDTLAPFIVEPPAHTETTNNGAALFSVYADGTPTLGYQWRFNGQDIPGATKDEYRIWNASPADDGWYSVVVANSHGSVTSAPARLIVHLPPEINEPPRDVSVPAGAIAQFAVRVGGEGPYTNQWYHNQTPVGLPLDEHIVFFWTNYDSVRVEAANRWGVTTSDPALISEGYNLFTNGGFESLTGWRWEGTFLWADDNSGLPLDPGNHAVSFHVTNTTAGDAVHQTFRVHERGVYRVSLKAGLAGDNPDSRTFNAAVFAGDGFSPLLADLGDTTLPANAWMEPYYFDFVAASNLVTLHIQDYPGTNANGHLVFDDLSVKLVGYYKGTNIVSVPQVLVQPVGLSVEVGDTFSIGSVVVGPGPLYSQWYHDGQPLTDVDVVTTNTWLTLTNATLTNSGYYQLLVSNVHGVVISEPVPVSVTTNAAPDIPFIVATPGEVTVEEGMSAAFSLGSQGVSDIDWQWHFGSNQLAGATQAGYELPVVSSNHAGVYWAVASNQLGGDVSGLVNLVVEPSPLLPPGGTLDPIILSQPQHLTHRQGETAILTVAATGGFTLDYQWYREGQAIVGATSPLLQLTNVLPAHGGRYQVMVSNTNGYVVSEPALLTVDAANPVDETPPYIIQHPPSLHAPLNHPVAFGVVAGGSPPLSYQWYLSTNLLAGAVTPGLISLGVTESDVGPYTVAISNQWGSTVGGPAHLTVFDPGFDPDDFMPRITMQPRAIYGVTNLDYAFTVGVEGRDPLRYTWYKDGVALPGSDNQVFRLISVQTNDQGSYHVRVENPFGYATSSNAVLEVFDEDVFEGIVPQIYVQPQSQHVPRYNTITLNFHAYGKSPLSYQWFKNGSVITGATDAVLTLANVEFDDDGQYQVQVSNPAGATLSQAADILVYDDPPVITRHPVSQTVAENGRVFFHVRAFSQVPHRMGYQWYHDGAPVPGATNATLMFPMYPEDVGHYYAVVDDKHYYVTSDVAMLNLQPALDTRKFDVKMISPYTFTAEPVKAKVGQPLLLSALAGDQLYGVDSVEFFRIPKHSSTNGISGNTNGIPIGKATRAWGSTYNYTWHTPVAGEYDIVAHAVNGDKIELTSTPIPVEVEWSPGFGHFSAVKTDVEIPAVGVPLTIRRVHDAHFNDFGEFGWNATLDSRLAKVETKGSLASGWTVERVAAPISVSYEISSTESHLVKVKLLDKFVEFEPLIKADATGTNGQWGMNPESFGEQVYMFFEPSFSSGGKLMIPGLNDNLWPTMVRDEDTGPMTLNVPPTIERYLYTQPGGLTYSIHSVNGTESITDRNGNSITIETNAINHSCGLQLLIRRDWANRIIAVHDPVGLNPDGSTNGAPVIRYTYDEIGNLKTVERLQNRSLGNYATNTYHYADTNFPHHITGIDDPYSRVTLRLVYDDKGRIIRKTDALGYHDDYNYDDANLIVTHSDRVGKQTREYYNQYGQLQHTEEEGEFRGSRQYDHFGRVTNQVDLTGNITTLEYDANHRLTNSFTIAADGGTNGTVASIAYTKDGLPKTVNTGNGAGTSFAYDGAGNPIQIQGGSTESRYGYDPNMGLKIAETNAFGTSLETFKHYGYDACGRLLSVTGTLGHWTTNTYDANGNKLTSVTWRTSEGQIRYLTNRFQYDAQNRRIASQDAMGYWKNTEFDLMGRATNKIDAKSRSTRKIYDNAGRVLHTIYPDDTTNSNTYDPEGRRISSTDRTGLLTEYFYNHLGRITNTVVHAEEEVHTSVIYDDRGRIFSTLDARGFGSTNYFSQSGQLTNIVNAVGITNGYAYDNQGRETYVTNAVGTALETWVHTVYDSDGNPTETHFPDGTFTWTGFDILGRMEYLRDRNGVTNQLHYDIEGRLKGVTSALGSTNETHTSYGYDELGNQISQTDALGRVTTFVYDDLRRRVKRILPNGVTMEQFAYDAVGNRTNRVDFGGRETQYAYDNMDRLTNRSYVNGGFDNPTISFTYKTGTSLRKTMIDGVGTTTYFYDLRGRLKTKSTPLGTLHYSRDSDSGVTNITSSTFGGASMQYTRDGLGRVIQAHDAAFGTTDYYYNELGNLSVQALPNNVTNWYSHDALGRLTNVVAYNGIGTRLAEFTYYRDAVGKRTNDVEFLATHERGLNYRYDNLNRLLTETVLTNDVIFAAINDYRYDDVGNRTSAVYEDLLAGVTNSYDDIFDSHDRVISGGFEYDDAGNTTIVLDENGNVVFTDEYSFENKLIRRRDSSNNILLEMEYSGDGRRASKMIYTSPTTWVRTQFLLEDRNPTGYVQVIEEHVQTSGGISSLATVYTYGLDLIGERYEDSGNPWITRFHGHDGHGSVRYLTDDIGVVTDTYTYDAYGNLIDQTALGTASYNNFFFTGEQYDADLGLYYLRSRYYSPLLGRFWTMDSWEGELENPPTLNKYLYTHGNPLNGTDPSGHWMNLSGMQVMTIISVSINGASAYNNFRAKRYGWMAVDILAMALGAYGFGGGSGPFYQWAMAGSRSGALSWAAVSAGGANAAMGVSHGVAVWDLWVMAVFSVPAGGGAGDKSSSGSDGNEGLPNRYLDTFESEMNTAKQLGVQAEVVKDGPQLLSLLNGVRSLKWVLRMDGSLSVVPAKVGGREISHAVATGSKNNVRGAGYMRLSNGKLQVSVWSGHYRPEFVGKAAELMEKLTKLSLEYVKGPL